MILLQCLTTQIMNYQPYLASYVYTSRNFGHVIYIFICNMELKDPAASVKHKIYLVWPNGHVQIPRGPLSLVIINFNFLFKSYISELRAG